MKRVQIAWIIVISMIAICGVAYWLLAIRESESPLLVDSQGDIEQARLHSEERALQESYDEPISEFLVGRWSCEGDPYIERFVWTDSDRVGDSKEDFVDISSDGSCKFSLDEFKYDGDVAYERAYAGYYTEFIHKNKTYIFIFSPHDESWHDDTLNPLAVAFVGHDPKPRFREIDYKGQFKK